MLYLVVFDHALAPASRIPQLLFLYFVCILQLFVALDLFNPEVEIRLVLFTLLPEGLHPKTVVPQSCGGVELPRIQPVAEFLACSSQGLLRPALVLGHPHLPQQTEFLDSDGPINFLQGDFRPAELLGPLVEAVTGTGLGSPTSVDGKALACGGVLLVWLQFGL